MIQNEKYQHALRSLNSILTRARWMAHESDSPELAELLDAAEILPKYIAQPEDATAEFRTTVEDIASRFQQCAHVSDEFNDECACIW